MRRHDFRENKKPLVMIIPMIDIMLFLLVFFMISTIYMVQTNSFHVNLPQSKISEQETRKNIISITITENGEIIYDKEKIILSEQLSQKILETLRNDKETVFIIRGDKSVKYEKVVNVLEILKKSSVKNISIATEVKK